MMLVPMPSSCGCDRLVADVEALHAHLGFERIDLAGHYLWLDDPAWLAAAVNAFPGPAAA